jgi:acetoin utilization deacetylase AcuC-like enzyme
MQFGVAIDPVFEDHVNPEYHPESSHRIRAISRALDGWAKAGEVTFFPPKTIETSWLEKVHTKGHVERIRRTEGIEHTQIDPDTSACAESYRVALKAAGSTVDLTERILKGEIDSGFALVRPPGHHAESHRAMGFCLFNNVAVAAEWALSQPGIERVAAVDFDVHHGNGIQEIFYYRSDVLYVSSHQYPLFPGTGHWKELGIDQGRGFTVNLPISEGAGNSFFVPAYQDVVAPVLCQYKPDLILVSAGYDAHRDDPLAGLEVDETGFRVLVELLNSVAEEVCSGKILYVLEGGYNLPALSSCVLATIDSTLSPTGMKHRPNPPTYYLRYREQMRRYLKGFWEI